MSSLEQTSLPSPAEACWNWYARAALKRLEGPAPREVTRAEMFWRILFSVLLTRELAGHADGS
jgi:hypothetical protein